MEHKKNIERLISLHEANYKVFKRRIENNGWRDPEYCRELENEATAAAMAVRDLKNGLAIDAALENSGMVVEFRL